MFTEADRVQVRRWLGFSNLYLSVDPRLEGSLVAIQSVADGGSRPDNAAELAIKSHLAKLTAIEARTEDLHIQMAVGKVDDEVELDAPRGLQALRSLGRQYVGHISDALGVKPLRDVFSPAELSDYAS
jgi:hypothetical protein